MAHILLQQEPEGALRAPHSAISRSLTPRVAGIPLTTRTPVARISLATGVFVRRAQRGHIRIPAGDPRHPGATWPATGSEVMAYITLLRDT